MSTDNNSWFKKYKSTYFFLLILQLKMTPLHWAVESGDCKSVELLLRHGADIYVENKFDKSPLEIASDKGNTDIYEMLLNAESYRMIANNTAESELATRTISTEMNAHQQVGILGFTTDIKIIS